MKVWIQSIVMLVSENEEELGGKRITRERKTGINRITTWGRRRPYQRSHGPGGHFSASSAAKGPGTWGTRWDHAECGSTPTLQSHEKCYRKLRRYQNRAFWGHERGGEAGRIRTWSPRFAAAPHPRTGALTIMAINKQMLARARPRTIGWTNFLPSGTAQVWRLNLGERHYSIERYCLFREFPEQHLAATKPSRCFVLSAGRGHRIFGPGTFGCRKQFFDLWLDGIVGQRYENSGPERNFVNWVCGPNKTRWPATQCIWLSQRERPALSGFTAPRWVCPLSETTKLQHPSSQRSSELFKHPKASRPLAPLHLQ